MKSYNDAIIFLNKYGKGTKILELSDLNEAEVKRLPDSWVDILSKKEHERLAVVQKYWNEFNDEFSMVTEYLLENLVCVYLNFRNDNYYLMYGITSKNKNKTNYYEARNPSEKKISQSVKEKWALLPDSLKRFYEFHDGWYFLASNSMGLSAAEDMFIFAEEFKEILCDIDDHSLDLNNILTLFSNGMGGYLCADLSKKENSYLLWWHDEEPDLNVNLWGVVDAWTLISIEE